MYTIARMLCDPFTCLFALGYLLFILQLFGSCLNPSLFSAVCAIIIKLRRRKMLPASSYLDTDKTARFLIQPSVENAFPVGFLSLKGSDYSA